MKALKVKTRQRKIVGLIAAVFASTLLLNQSQANQPQQNLLKISSVNGEYNFNHPEVIDVHEGDVINLSADIYNASEKYQAEGRDLEQFVWQASDSDSDICYANDAENCEANSNFQVNDYGVSFYAPANMPRDIQISVYSHQDSDVDSDGQQLMDVITLHNADYRVNAPPPVTVTSAEEYPYEQYNDDLALRGHGRWVTIEGVRYFVPYTYLIGGESQWEPYRNGYWSWDVSMGWTWISYDPWGWATDHRGVWRHHNSYGWIWLPFLDHHYEPHCVTWFHEGGYVGWYPYFNNYGHAYRHGYERGFNDGFERGIELGRTYGRDHDRFHPGYTIVHERNVTHANILLVTENRISISSSHISIIQNAHQRNSVYNIPGGSRQNSRIFIESRSSSPGTSTTTRIVVTRGGARIQVSEQRIPTPAANRIIIEGGHSHRPVAVGTVIRVTENGRGAPTTHHIPPSADRRGVSNPPVIHDSHGNPIQTIGVQTRNPSRPHTDNPISTGRERAGPPQTPVVTRPVPTEKPKPQPRQPIPQPTPPRKPGSDPTPHPRPIPAPAPQPKPQPKPQPTPKCQPGKKC